MIGIDTNILVRLITNDDPEMAGQARVYLQQAADAGVFVNSIVLCELAWTLTRSYRYSRAEVLKVFFDLMAHPSLIFEDEGEMQAGMQALEQNIDFADGVIGRRNLTVGCETTGTFDRRAAALDTFETVPAAAP